MFNFGIKDVEYLSFVSSFVDSRLHVTFDGFEDPVLFVRKSLAGTWVPLPFADQVYLMKAKFAGGIEGIE